MKEINFDKGQFVLCDEEERIVLLDANKRLENKSRLPMHTLSDGPTIPNLLVELVNQHKEISKGTEESLFSTYLLDILLTSYLIRTSAPIKVLELGAVSGILSYHLATLMGKLNPESTLCCVSDVIGNESGSRWLNRISMVEQLPKISMVAADYEETHLESDSFDIVILNGTAGFVQPYETIREAKRLVKPKGMLFCYAKDAPLLKSSFQLVFPERQEYEGNPRETILRTCYEGVSWGKRNVPNLAQEKMEVFRELRYLVTAQKSQEYLRSWIPKLDACVDQAVREYDSKTKAELLQLKEHALDYMLNLGSEWEGVYREELLACERNLREAERNDDDKAGEKPNSKDSTDHRRGSWGNLQSNQKAG